MIIPLMKREPIAINSSNAPIIVHVFEIDNENERVICGVGSMFKDSNDYVKKIRPRARKIYYTPSGRAYFRCFETRFYLDACIRTDI